MIEIIEDLRTWTGAIAAFSERPLYLSSLWAEYKRRQGWRFRCLSWNGQGTRAAALVQQRRLTRFGPLLTLVQGGPVVADDRHVADALAAVLHHATASPLGVEALLPAQVLTPTLIEAMTAQGFREVTIPGTGTVLLDLTADEAVLRQALSKNWRHNLSRAEKRGLEIRWIGRGVAERQEASERMAALYDALIERKSFAKALDVRTLTAAAGDEPDLEWLEVWQGETLLASRMGWMGGDTALDLLAASSDAAKTTYANYLALWSLINRARQRGALRFDCGGIDPEGNVGVYNFKKGLNGREEHLGRMWLRTRPGFLWPLAARRLASRTA